MHYAAAALMISIYMYNLPLMIAMVWRDGRFALGMGAFDWRYAANNAAKKLGRQRYIRKKKKGGASGIRHAVGLIKIAAIERFSARLLVGTGDAASAAVLCGALNALGGALRSTAKNGEVDIRPDFCGEDIRGEICVVASVKLGRLFGNAVRTLLDG